MSAPVMDGAAIAERLQAFLERLDGKPVVWGNTDCSAAPALWMSEVTGRAITLPRYGSREEAHAIIAAKGSLADVWSEIAHRHGVSERYGEPEPGDVGIVDTRLYGEIGGICGHSRVLIIRKDNGGWHPFGPVRRFVKVFAAS